jgi:hypothetical protein
MPCEPGWVRLAAGVAPRTDRVVTLDGRVVAGRIVGRTEVAGVHFPEGTDVLGHRPHWASCARGKGDAP